MVPLLEYDGTALLWSAPDFLAPDLNGQFNFSFVFFTFLFPMVIFYTLVCHKYNNHVHRIRFVVGVLLCANRL